MPFLSLVVVLVALALIGGPGGRVWTALGIVAAIPPLLIVVQLADSFYIGGDGMLFVAMLGSAPAAAAMAVVLAVRARRVA